MRLIWITLQQTLASDLIVNPSKLLPFFHTIIKVKLCFHLMNNSTRISWITDLTLINKINIEKYWPDWIFWANPHQHNSSPSWCPAPYTWCTRCQGQPSCWWCVLLLVCGQHLCSAHLSPTQIITDRDRTGELGVRSQSRSMTCPSPTWIGAKIFFIEITGAVCLTTMCSLLHNSWSGISWQNTYRQDCISSFPDINLFHQEQRYVYKVNRKKFNKHSALAVRP